MMARFSDWDRLSGVPDGYRPPYTWLLPIEGGALRSFSHIDGIGSLASAIIGRLDAESYITGAGTVSVADLRAIAALVAAIIGTGDLTTVMGAVPANMSADITVSNQDPLTPENLAASVWNALAASYDDPETMGEKMNDVLTVIKFLGLK